MEIRAKTIAQVHMRVCEAIAKCDDSIYYTSEDGEKMLEYPEPILVIVDEPISDDMISPLCKFGERSMNQYVYDLMNGTDNEFVYTYHDRLFAYECGYEETPKDYSCVVNQIKGIIKKLKECPTSRRAQAITWYPEEDLFSDNPPCLQRMQFTIRNGQLNMHVTFRSNDCLSAMMANMYAFVHLQKYVAEQIGVPIGYYTHYIVSAHLYPKRDAEEYNKLRRLVYK
jgi:thymidylate synthase